jgi:hypothetical protein
MPYLKYYQDERSEFKEEYEKKLPNEDATIIVIKKLLKHYKLGNLNISFTSGRNYSHAGRYNICINTESMNNFAVVCHELAHTYQARKEGFERGDKWHTKKHKKIMKRMLNYCKKKNWFEEEINRRTLPKPQKIEPTKDEQRIKRISVLEKRKESYERRIRLSENKIKKINRQIAGLKRFL